MRKGLFNSLAEILFVWVVAAERGARATHGLCNIPGVGPEAQTMSAAS